MAAAHTAITKREAVWLGHSKSPALWSSHPGSETPTTLSVWPRSSLPSARPGMPERKASTETLASRRARHQSVRARAGTSGATSWPQAGCGNSSSSDNGRSGSWRGSAVTTAATGCWRWGWRPIPPPHPSHMMVGRWWAQ